MFFSHTIRMNSTSTWGTHRAVATLSRMLAWTVFGLTLAACQLAGGKSSLERLQESVSSVNEDARWGRLDLASAKVTDSYKPQFLAARENWNKSIQIADVELSNVELEGEQEHAISDVTINWYSLNSMELHSTSIRQQWKSRGHGFVLVKEHITDGDPDLLIKPKPKNPAQNTANAPAKTTAQNTESTP